MLKVVIIDDEPDAVHAISLIIHEYCNFAEVAGTATSINEGREIIGNIHPDIVILDIEMPRGNGFDLLESLPQRNFEVIFITAYNHYAIKAFKYSAIDYILKPVDIDEFVAALEKARHRLSHPGSFESRYNSLNDNMRGPFPTKITLTTMDNMEFIKVADIIRIEANGSYCKVFFNGENTIMVSKSMKEFQDILEPETFFRSHNSHIININHVKRFWFRDGGYLELDDNSHVPISRRKKEEFLRIINKLTGKSN